MSESKRPYFRNSAEAFAARTERRGECLIWVGAKSASGYGRLWGNGKMVYAHRYAWELANGPIPAGMLVDHREHCDRACVEMTHLRLSTNAQNSANRAGANVSNAATGARNVYPHRRGFQVAIKKNGVKRTFGTYSTVEEAAKVAAEKRAELFGEFAGER